MKAYNKWLSSASILMGAVAISALPVWGQVGSQSEKSAGSSSESQGSSGMKESREGQTSGQEQGEIQGSGGMRESRGQSQSRRAAGSEDVKKAQQALKDKGHDPGAIDGVLGPKTKEAVRAFQQQQGLSATGTLDNKTKEALGIEEGGSSKSIGSSKSSAASPRSGGASSSKSGGGSYESGPSQTEDDKPTPGSRSGVGDKSSGGSR